MDVNEMNLSLNGCGYLGIYHVGVCTCIKQYFPEVVRNKISGGSVGALVACAFMCDVPLSICVKYVFDVSVQVRNGILGPMTPNLNIMRLLYDRMDQMLPSDAHLRCDGRLYISVTRFDNGQNVMLNRFNSRDELLRALMCSCFIPVYCGYEPPIFHGVAYVDAALSNNSPCLDKHTVTVAPFAGNSDICPDNDGLALRCFTLSKTSIGFTKNNLYMLFRVLFPGSPDVQKDFCQQGYNDALRFLRDNDLVSCPDCVSGKAENGHSKCRPMEQLLPREITDEFETSIQEFRKNLSYRLFQHKSMKVLYYINMPSIIAAKVTFLAVSKIVQKLQNEDRICLESTWRDFLEYLKDKLDLCAAWIRRGTGNNYVTCPDKDCTQAESSEREKSEMDYEENSTTQPITLSTDVEIEVPETISTAFFPGECAVEQRTNDSCKLDLHLSDSKTEISGML